MRKTKRTLAGFSVLELVISLAVVGGLGALAWPAYKNFQRRTYFDGIVAALAPIKEGILSCYQDNHNLVKCDGSSKHIPATLLVPKDPIARVKVNDGVISVTPVPNNGVLSTDNYILTPQPNKNELVWKATGNAVTNGYVE